MEERLKIENLKFSYCSDEILKDINLNVKNGEFVGIIGPNGSGKSTILKNIYKALNPSSGNIYLDNEDISKMNYKHMANKLGVVGQENQIPFDFSVEEIVAMGRTPHKKLFELDTDEDKKIVVEALEKIGMKDMAKRSFRNLSGGEKQRVIIARALAQESDFLVLDEATNHLDISYQLSIFDFVKSLGITVISAIHDLNISALYCDRIYVIKEGEILFKGTPEEVFTSENIEEIYGIKSEVNIQPKTGKISISYLPESLIK